MNTADKRYYLKTCVDYMEMSYKSLYPVKDLAAARGMNPGTLAKHMHRAKNLGLWVSDGPGLTGGHLTREALEMLRNG